MTETENQVEVRNPDGNLHGISVTQKATSGRGSGLNVDSYNTAAPAAVVRGAGDLLDLRDSTGMSVLNVGNSGTSTLQGFTGAYPLIPNTFMPQDHGWKAWSSDPTGATNSSLLTNGTVYLSQIAVRTSTLVSNIVWWVSVAGATPVSSQNFVGLYNSSGTRLATVNVDASISAAGVKTSAITPVTLAAGKYWVAMVFNASTAPTIARASGLTGDGFNGGLTAATLRYATNGTGQTSLASSITPASNASSAFAGPWVAVS